MKLREMKTFSNQLAEVVRRLVRLHLAITSKQGRNRQIRTSASDSLESLAVKHKTIWQRTSGMIEKLIIIISYRSQSDKDCCTTFQ
ncbi:hypothetical protein EYF80_031615 [Liparis tanakae]|uniref:Uncharacterized protein n=1 Tax=Liparis tanakae TaxID=230148 RepID=A0A4Z2GZW6_9TELE|nr:hypothetical protein EYF80_031615 [Liparis tanakae]